MSNNRDNTVKKINFKQKKPHSEVFVRNGKIYKKKDDNEIEVGKEIKIEEIEKNIDTDELYLKLKFDYGRSEIETNIPRGYLGSRQKLITKLSKVGADIYSFNATPVIKHLKNQEFNILKQNRGDCINVHEKLGWWEYENKNVFKHYHSIGVDSKYIGKLDIKPRGSYQKWLSIIEKEVIGNTALETALVIGLSAAVVGLIGRDIGTESLLIHLYGDSTTGKTTASMLAVSPWGNPNTQGSGLMKDWNSTQNAMIGYLNDNKGLPIVFDESSMNKKRNITNMIYTMASGSGKGRMNKEAELKETSSWNTTIITNGEGSLNVKTDQNPGIHARLLEFGNIMWTKNAENADNLKRALLRNYGQSGYEFVKKLNELNKEEVISTHTSAKNKILENLIVKDKFSKRIATKLGLLLMTAKYANEFLSLDLNIKKIGAFLMKAEKEQYPQRNLGKKAYYYFKEKVGQNKPKFVGDKDKDETKRYEIWGKIKNGEISIYPEIFKEIMLDGGFEDPKLILKKWKEKYLLNHEKNRLKNKRIISGERQRVYVIKQKANYE